jgi:hypothetical protein
MNIIHSFETKDYKPISSGSFYLYNQYERIQGFLRKQLGESYANLLAKPVHKDGQVDWYGPFPDRLPRIAELPQSIQENILNDYWSIIHHVLKRADELLSSSNKDHNTWGTLLKEIFNSDKNIILSDGNTWILIWGWEFSTGQENYLPANFGIEDPNKPVEEDPELPRIPDKPIIPTGEPTRRVDVSNPLPPETRPTEQPKPSQKPLARPARLSIWERIKRFFRFITYKLWALMLLIILTLLLICLCRSCCCKKGGTTNSDLDSLNRQLQELDQRIQLQCPDTANHAQ